ncbi:MAG: hypothetical protein E7191_02400 [Erysipelotrichaceae bacterium]|nr:hypothetical protein [Erysipelotrichaceae bacterium]
MIQLNYVLKNDYDKVIKLGNESVFCYSDKKIKELYPSGGYELVAETNGKLGSAEKVGILTVSTMNISIYSQGTYKGLNKVIGYVAVGEDQYVAFYKSNAAFIAIVLGLLTLILGAAILIGWLFANPKPPVVIEPDNPQPSVDPGIVEIDPISPLPDKPEVTPSSSGGGSVSMVFTKGVTVSLSSDTSEIYYQNPDTSDHNAVLELYIVSDGVEYFIGKTGVIPPGNALYEMSIAERDAKISTGVYMGLFRVSFYNPVTGERAPLQSDITEVTVTVTE